MEIKSEQWLMMMAASYPKVPWHAKEYRIYDHHEGEMVVFEWYHDGKRMGCKVPAAYAPYVREYFQEGRSEIMPLMTKLDELEAQVKTLEYEQRRKSQKQKMATARFRDDEPKLPALLIHTCSDCKIEFLPLIPEEQQCAVCSELRDLKAITQRRRDERNSLRWKFACYTLALITLIFMVVNYL